MESWYSIETCIYIVLGIIFVSAAICSATIKYKHSLITNEKIFGILIILGIILYAVWLIKQYIKR